MGLHNSFLKHIMLFYELFRFNMKGVLMKPLGKLFLCIFLLSQAIAGQSLTDIYKSGEITFQPDKNFQTSVQFFYNRNEPIKNYSNLAFASDGSVFVLDRGTHQILMFQPDGQYLKALSINIPISTSVYHGIQGMDILDNQYIVVAGYDQLLVYDFGGKFIKTIKKDYSLMKMVALKENKVAVEGSVSLGGSMMRRYVGIIDIDTEEDVSAVQYEEDLSEETVSFKAGHGTMSFSSSTYHPRVYLSRTSDGNLIAGYSENPEVTIYPPAATKLADIRLEYPAMTLSKEELQAMKARYTKSVKRAIEQFDGPDSLLDVVQSDDFYRRQIPYFYGIKTDSEGNILIFRQEQDEANHVFRVYRVYSNQGEFICETTMDFGAYTRPDLRRIAFHGKFLYGIMQKANTKLIGLVRGTFQ